MKLHEDKSHWLSPELRSDGLRIARTTDQLGYAVVAEGKPNIYKCPCCDNPLLTPRAAQMIADTVYPLTHPKE